MVQRGIYADQLAPFLTRFPVGSHLLVLRSEDFFQNEAATMAQLASFLGLVPIEWSAIVQVKFNFERGANVQATGVDDATYVLTQPTEFKTLGPGSERGRGAAFALIKWE